MEAARQAEHIGLELYDQGVTEQDIHIIYGELGVLRELQLKRGAHWSRHKTWMLGSTYPGQFVWRFLLMCFPAIMYPD